MPRGPVPGKQSLRKMKRTRQVRITEGRATEQVAPAPSPIRSRPANLALRQARRAAGFTLASLAAALALHLDPGGVHHHDLGLGQGGSAVLTAALVPQLSPHLCSSVVS